MVEDICPVCGLPKDLCVCKDIEREEATQRIKVYTEKAKFRKYVTIIEGIEKQQAKDVFKELKRKLACGGAIKEGKLILQGDHKKKVKELLVKMGYKENLIEVI